MIQWLLFIVFSALASSTQNPEPLLVSVDDAAHLLGVSRRTAVKLLDAKELRGLKVGRRRMVPIAAIHEYIAERVAS